MQSLKILRFVWRHPLNARNRLASIIRVARWQIGSRLIPGPTALPFVGDTRLLVSRGMTGATGNWYCGLHEPAEMGFVLHALRREDAFVDVGANVGSYTILAGGAVGARVTAVEPIPATYEALRRNVALNGLDQRVRTWRGGLSDKDGALRFSTGLDSMNHVLAPGEDLPAIEVPVSTLDALVGDEVPALIKIDVEGHERAVLEGGGQTLADRRLLALIIETNGSGSRYGVADDEITALMARHGFKPFRYNPFERVLVPLVAPADGNTIFVRDLDAVNARLRTAPKYRLVNGEI